jgi:hypothetical protein
MRGRKGPLMTVPFMAWRRGVIGALIIGLALTSTLAQEALTAVKPLGGKWASFIATPRGSGPADGTIRDGGL